MTREERKRNQNTNDDSVGVDDDDDNDDDGGGGRRNRDDDLGDRGRRKNSWNKKMDIVPILFGEKVASNCTTSGIDACFELRNKVTRFFTRKPCR